MQIEREQLVRRTEEARERAYAPYSDYRVGAALQASSGRIYTGCNVENAAYPQSMCAERTALFKAISEGERDFVAIAVVTQDGGSPCGACRQVLSEFSSSMLVLISDSVGNVRETTTGELLPDHFGPHNLR